MQPPTDADLEAYGITPDFRDFIRSLNYSVFRDYPAPPSPQGGEGGAGSPGAGETSVPPPPLNPWQARHASLVVRSVLEVDQLRYILCPRYMTDERFWTVYFALAARNLPAGAGTWAEGDTLPPLSGDVAEVEGVGSPLSELGGHLKELGAKIQGAAHSRE
jgi:hypothetical protein